jgi:hypothetical protein
MPWANPVQLPDPMDGRAVMVHDPSLGHTGGYPSNWYFVPTSCMRLPA